MQPMTPALFDGLVLCKPYFDRDGLIIAEERGELIGFAHAGFGANEDGSAIDLSRGVICMLQVMSHDTGGEVATCLLAACEEYLVARGATTIFGGAHHSVDPFYLGLYCGSSLSGVPTSDKSLTNLLRGANYEAVAETMIMRRTLSGFRPVVDRHQMQIRRANHVACSLDPPSDTWWHACTWGHTERHEFTLQTRQGADRVASIVVWDCEPIASSWGVHVAGIARLRVNGVEGRESLALFLIGEALRQAQTRGTTLAEVHVPIASEADLQLYTRLGFEEIDRAIVYERRA